MVIQKELSEPRPVVSIPLPMAAHSSMVVQKEQSETRLVASMPLPMAAISKVMLAIAVGIVRMARMLLYRLGRSGQRLVDHCLAHSSQ